jgi:hypothetical protein
MVAERNNASLVRAIRVVEEYDASMLDRYAKVLRYGYRHSATIMPKANIESAANEQKNRESQ